MANDDEDESGSDEMGGTTEGVCWGVIKIARMPWAAPDDALAKRWALCHACMIRPTQLDCMGLTPPFLDREYMGRAKGWERPNVKHPL